MHSLAVDHMCHGRHEQSWEKVRKSFVLQSHYRQCQCSILCLSSRPLVHRFITVHTCKVQNFECQAQFILTDISLQQTNNTVPTSSDTRTCSLAPGPSPQLSSLLILQATIATVEDWERGYCDIVLYIHVHTVYVAVPDRNRILFRHVFGAHH